MCRSEGTVSVPLHILQGSKYILGLRQYVILVCNPLIVCSKDPSLVSDQLPMLRFYPRFLGRPLISLDVAFLN